MATRRTAFASLNDFLNSPLPDGDSSISFGSLKLFLRLGKKQETRKLVVIFSAANRRTPERSPPFFHGVKISEVINANVLMVDDIAHQSGENVGIGWHIGTREVNSQQVIPIVINHAAAQLGASDVVLAGGSAGGFAALYYGSIIPSTVMVVNPQTDILSYHHQHVVPYLSTCHGWVAGRSMRDYLPDRVSSLPAHIASAPPMRAVYFQNYDDTHHLEMHAGALLKSLGGCADPKDARHHGIDFYFRRWGEGHNALPPTSFAACLNHILAHGVDGVADTLGESLKGLEVEAA